VAPTANLYSDGRLLERSGAGARWAWATRTGGVAMIGVCLALFLAVSAYAAPSGVAGDTVRTCYPTRVSGATTGVSYVPGVLGRALSLDRIGACVQRERANHLDPAIWTPSSAKGLSRRLMPSRLPPTRRRPQQSVCSAVVVPPWSSRRPCRRSRSRRREPGDRCAGASTQSAVPCRCRTCSRDPEAVLGHIESSLVLF
jgi:hypothetical protein